MLPTILLAFGLQTPAPVVDQKAPPAVVAQQPTQAVAAPPAAPTKPDVIQLTMDCVQPAQDVFPCVEQLAKWTSYPWSRDEIFRAAQLLEATCAIMPRDNYVNRRKLYTCQVEAGRMYRGVLDLLCGGDMLGCEPYKDSIERNVALSKQAQKLAADEFPMAVLTAQGMLKEREISSDPNHPDYPACGD